MTASWPPAGRPAGAVPLGLRRWFLLFFVAGLLWVALEVFVLILLGQQIGWGLTILLMIATSLLGAWVLRREGPRSWQAFRTDLRERRPPGASAADGLLVLVGGVLMLTPGFVSDVAGALLVAPPTRRFASGRVQSLLTRRMTPSAATTLFGPRTVRVRTGTPQPPPAAPNPSAGPIADGPGEPIEGEIIDPPSR
jgi:UPF0716 protein FxsA